MKYLIIGAALILSATQLKSQEKIKTDSLHVEGVCKMCQSRIQKFAYGKGVKFAEWNLTNSYLKLVYNSEKTNLEDISKRVAKAGHSTNLTKATEEAYGKLPNCCQYESVEKH
jgi:hypothetical protein